MELLKCCETWEGQWGYEKPWIWGLETEGGSHNESLDQERGVLGGLICESCNQDHTLALWRDEPGSRQSKS